MAPVPGLDPESSLWHWMASDLRFYRERAGLSLAQMGQIMGATKQGVSNIEHGREGHRLQERHAKALDKYFDLNDHFYRLVQYAKRKHNPDWLAEHVRYETLSSSIWVFSPLWITGLLQTETYATTSFSVAGVVDPTGLVKRRLLRQEILRRPRPPDLWVILDEAAILRTVGSNAEMADQLRHVIEMASLQHVSVRVVPMSAGAYLGQDGAVKIMSVGVERLGYFEAPTGGRLVKDIDEVVRMTRRYDRISTKALPEDLSADLIRKRMKELHDGVA